MSDSERLDQYVATQLPQLSRSSAAKLIDMGQVKVNNKVILKASYKVAADDHVVIDYSKEKYAEHPKIELPLIYEDDDCVVINKPVGVLSHSKGAFNPEATVATWLSDKWQGEANERAGIVHRLDRATSGVMICAKNAEAQAWLQKQFGQRRVKKTYYAIVEGELNPAEAIIDMAIERNPKKPQTFRVGSNGKSAVTAYKVIKAGEQYSLVELKPTTGRTHQLRVHLKQLNHPILGDTFYDGKAADRLYLHAGELEITLPNRERKIFTAPMPKQFKTIVK